MKIKDNKQFEHKHVHVSSRQLYILLFVVGYCRLREAGASDTKLSKNKHSYGIETLTAGKCVYTCAYVQLNRKDG